MRDSVTELAAGKRTARARSSRPLARCAPGLPIGSSQPSNSNLLITPDSAEADHSREGTLSAWAGRSGGPASHSSRAPTRGPGAERTGHVTATARGQERRFYARFLARGRPGGDSLLRTEHAPPCGGASRRRVRPRAGTSTGWRDVCRRVCEDRPRECRGGVYAVKNPHPSTQFWPRFCRRKEAKNRQE